MTKKELLETTFESSCDAMHALNEFLINIDKSFKDEKRSDYQHLRVIGNRIFD